MAAVTICSDFHASHTELITLEFSRLLQGSVAPGPRLRVVETPVVLEHSGERKSLPGGQTTGGASAAWLWEDMEQTQTRQCLRLAAGQDARTCLPPIPTKGPVSPWLDPCHSSEQCWLQCLWPLWGGAALSAEWSPPLRLHVER